MPFASIFLAALAQALAPVAAQLGQEIIVAIFSQIHLNMTTISMASGGQAPVPPHAIPTAPAAQSPAPANLPYTGFTSGTVTEQK